MTVAELLDEARDFHPSFTRQNIPDVPVMRALSRYVRRLAAKVVEQDEAALAVTVTVENADLLAAVTAGTGIALPSHLSLLQPVYAVRTSDGYRQPVDIVDHVSRNQAKRFPAASLVGGKLYPLDLRNLLGTSYDEHGWEEYDDLELLIVPLAADLTGPTDVVDLPDVCRDAIVHHLALFMAGRSSAAVRDLPLLPTQALDAEAVAVRSLADQSNTANWRIGR